MDYLSKLENQSIYIMREAFNKKGKKYLTLTDKGMAYLQKYRSMREFIDEFDL